MEKIIYWLCKNIKILYESDLWEVAFLTDANRKHTIINFLQNTL